MNRVLQFVGPDKALQLFGVKLVGLTGENGKKMLLSLVFIGLIWIFGWGVGKLAGALLRQRSGRSAFWAKQSVHLFSAVAVVIVLCSVWFTDPARLATAFGLITAGLAFALQRVITAVAAYFVILRGKTFNIGDRVVMGGVRGDVIELSFIQTTIMEMGEPPSVDSADPAMWVRSRQYTGRIVSLTNDKIFEAPVYNYSRDFPYIWEEMLIPVSYTADVARAEQIMLCAAREATLQFDEIGDAALSELERRYAVRRSQLEPRVYVRLTDNWVELSVRFLTSEHGIRDIKDKLSRELLKEFTRAGIGIASSTYDIVGMPPISIRLENANHEKNQLAQDPADTGPAAGAIHGPESDGR